jgi:hypothetical protein
MFVAALALLAVPACGQAQVARPTVARLQAQRTSNDSAALIRRYGGSLPDSEFDTIPGAGDEQRLMRGNCPNDCSYGPLARIQPRKRAATWQPAQRDSGEVIARIISEGPYPKFNIQGGDVVYWWVGRQGKKPVSIFISSRPGTPARVSDLDVDPHPGYWKQGLARWLWSDRDEQAWAVCDGGTCCRSSGK